MAILDEPGQVGDVMDGYAKRLAKVFGELTTNNTIGQTKVFFQNTEKTLRDVFQATTFNPLGAASDQIGRQPEGNQADVVNWLIERLNLPLSESVEDKYLHVLTKVKAISSFGTTLWQLFAVTSEHLESNKQAVNELLHAAGLSEKENSILWARFSEFKEKTRSVLFDDPVTRARSERMPLLNGQPVAGIYSDASVHGLGFGQVIQHTDNEVSTQELSNLLSGGGNKNSQINAIPREGAPIQDLTRPFMMSENEFRDMPNVYEAAGLRGKVNEHRFNHGVGINRWQPYGLYGMDSNKSGYPSAGAQSGGTTDIMLALSMLDLKEETSLYGKEKEVLCMTLATAAFMNFGGYHTFSEVFPIGEAIAKNIKFIPTDVAREFRTKPLYKKMLDVYGKYGSAEEFKRLKKFEATHRKRSIAKSHRNMSEYMTPDEFTPAFITNLGR
ncbi:hypothetical protein C4K37_3833 [Pseudomonas chlororaphis subsp. piscium]|uniref:Uncharacterized protein n=2 Tax=Pseudomonas chlororaphis TaxID=587753 RepID=A0AAX3FPY8_9PSED|nr:hypothetical protein C4K37_3833 [Pseudomonas chlororaphis subsp. piscium]AZC44766.1 hypothetical protein C4K36_3843 [Pseudomonas chlororaphis subsp. piscium]VEF72714.1 Uncharacterised protein [Pseudomonas chlororaphis]